MLIKHLSFSFVVFSFLVVAFFTPHPISAQVLISEVQPNPTTGPEWVELYNTASSSTSLSNHTISDQLASPSIIYTFATEATIGPNQYLLVELPTQKLNNNGDGVTLADQNKTIIDQMQFETSEPGKTWSRKSWDSNIFILTEATPGLPNLLPPPPTPTPTPTPTPSQTPQPTPTSQPSSPVPTPLPSKPSPLTTTTTDFVELWSIIPCPNKSEPEEVEIYNPLTYSVNLNSWYIQDEQNNTIALPATEIENGGVL